MKPQQTMVIKGPSMSSYNKDLLNSILGGEMKNAWQKEERSGQDIRSDEMKGIDRRPREDAYRSNYEKIFGHD